MVWEISDHLYRNITFDPTKFWFTVTRYGRGKGDTRYEIEVGQEANDVEKKLAESKERYNLELVAKETRSRRSFSHKRKMRSNSV